jgi:threonine aldolase
MFDLAAVRTAMRPPDSHFPQTALIVIENTHNRGGGTCWQLDEIAKIRAFADENRVRMHLDGARLMNACVAKGHKPPQYARYFDTVSICFSKGLGAPVGSAVASTKETIKRVHRFRKMFGGGMRQAGIIAAAAIYALEHNIERLAEDHANAKRLAAGIGQLPGVSIDVSAVETNILYVDVAESTGTAKWLCDQLREKNVWMLPTGPQRIRAVTHLDVTTEDIDRALATMNGVLRSFRAATGRERC